MLYDRKNLTDVELYYTNGSVSSTSSTNWYLRSTPSALRTSNTFCSAEIYIPNYATSNTKPSLAVVVSEDNGTTYAWIMLSSEFYNSSSAISSLSINASSGNFVANSSFYLYGISKS
mgnify:CR=1 FL=1